MSFLDSHIAYIEKGRSKKSERLSPSPFLSLSFPGPLPKNFYLVFQQVSLSFSNIKQLPKDHFLNT